jgi:hypothetical protein
MLLALKINLNSQTDTTELYYYSLSVGAKKKPFLVQGGYLKYFTRVTNTLAYPSKVKK